MRFATTHRTRGSRRRSSLSSSPNSSRRRPGFFSNGTLRSFAAGGPAPELPAGTTESEKRGRLFFVDAPFEPPGKAGVCALCHSGPMLNEANVFSTAVFGNPPGIREFGIGVSERNVVDNPYRRFSSTTRSVPLSK